MSTKTIPLSKPYLGEQEIAEVASVIHSGWVTQGPKVQAFESAFADYVGVKHACAVSSCTTALHLALITVGVKPGDVVITVSHSYIATSNAIRHCQAEPVFVDIEESSFNISATALASLLEEDFESIDGELYYRKVEALTVAESPLCHVNGRHGRLGALLVVHQLGMPCDLLAISKVIRTYSIHDYSIPLVEDAACAIGAEYLFDGGWQLIGSPLSDICCFSFHPRKILTTGDGGMLTTNDADYDDRFRVLRHHGMAVSDLERHRSTQVLISEHTTTGYNYRMTDIQAALGLIQLRRMPVFMQRRAEIMWQYCEQLAVIDWLELPLQPGYARSSWQSYAVTLREGAPLAQRALLEYLKQEGVSAAPGVMNAHQERPYSACAWLLPRSERARSGVVLLPCYHSLSNDEISEVVGVIKRCRL